MACVSTIGPVTAAASGWRPRAQDSVSCAKLASHQDFGKLKVEVIYG
jgi:hypothetical protein